MANSNEEQTALEQNPGSKSNELVNSNCHKSRFLLSGFILLIALLALGISVFHAKTNTHVLRELRADNKNMAAALEQLKQAQTNVQEQTDNKTDKLQQAQSDIQAKIITLNKSLQTAMNQKMYQKQDWLLLKARYYLELAQINAHWSTNYEATAALLQEADELLNKLNTPELLTIRQSIAKEMAQLKSIPAIDVAGLLSQLDAAQTSVTNLKLQTSPGELQSTTKNKSDKPSEPSTWRSHLHNSMDLLEKLIVIRRTDEAVTPLISPLFESVLKESIHLNLQEAQWAILNNNEAVYQLVLKQVIENITRTFNEKSANTAALLKQINALQQVRLAQEKPTIGSSLLLLNQLIDSKEPSASSQNTSTKGESR